MLQLYAPNGDLVYEESFHQNINTQLNISDLAPGYYLIKAIQANGEIIQQRIMID